MEGSLICSGRIARSSIGQVSVQSSTLRGHLRRRTRLPNQPAGADAADCTALQIITRGPDQVIHCRHDVLQSQ